MLPNLIIPTLVRTELLERALASIDYPIAHLLIIDNGAKYRKGKILELKKPEKVQLMTILSLPAPFGVAGAWNLGIKSFPFDDRWFISSDDVEFLPGGLEQWERQASTDALCSVAEWPYFQLFSVGEKVVDTVGLFDENYHPANFEDDDYLWRCQAAGKNVKTINVAHRHTSQGTVFHNDLARQNSRTYPVNEQRFKSKQNEKQLLAGDWQLSIRRMNDWE